MIAHCYLYGFGSREKAWRRFPVYTWLRSHERLECRRQLRNKFSLRFAGNFCNLSGCISAPSNRLRR